MSNITGLFILWGRHFLKEREVLQGYVKNVIFGAIYTHTRVCIYIG